MILKYYRLEDRLVLGKNWKKNSPEEVDFPVSFSFLAEAYLKRNVSRCITLRSTIKWGGNIRGAVWSYNGSAEQKMELIKSIKAIVS